MATPAQRARHAEYMKAYRQKHRPKFLAADRKRYQEQGSRQRNAQRLKRTGWCLEDIERALREQDGRCAVCEVVLEKGRGANAMVADHDHSTGRKRGLLCSRCNVLEGHHLKVALDEEEWGRRIKAFRAKFGS